MPWRDKFQGIFFLFFYECEIIAHDLFNNDYTKNGVMFNELIRLIFSRLKYIQVKKSNNNNKPKNNIEKTFEVSFHYFLKNKKN